MESPFTHVLLAIGPDHLERLLRETLLMGNREFGAQFEIVNTVAKEMKFLEELIQLEHPGIVILHERLPHSFNTNTMQGKEEKEREILELVEKWRIHYPSMRVVYVCERERNDPFLGDLVARNVLDIFYDRVIVQKDFIEQLMEPAHYKNVKQIRVGTVELEQEPETPESAAIENSKENIPFFAKVKQSAKGIKESIKTKAEQQKELKEKREKEEAEATAAKALAEAEIAKAKAETEAAAVKLKAEQVAAAPEPSVEEVEAPAPIPIKPPKENSFLKSTFSKAKGKTREKKQKEKELHITGTVTISVSSLLMQGGSTQLALSIASLLSQDSKDIAVVECNISGDFNRMHALHEGENPKGLEKITQFQLDSIDNITFFKLHSQLDIRSIQSKYDYVILDGGMYNHSRFTPDLDGSHIRFLITSAMEWKDYLIENFVKEQARKNGVEPDSFLFAIRETDNKRIKDLSKRFNKKYTFASIPSIPFPFELEKDAKVQLKEMLTTTL